jgi:two-component system OmpR family sensor kinase/two-component system sensor histidine kinase BaeS
MQSSVGEIRRRLLLLLLRAFTIVLFLSFGFFTISLGYFLTSSSVRGPFESVTTLEKYYLAKGSWDGAASVFASTDELNLMSTILLDKNQSIILDRRTNPTSGIPSSSPIGSHYEFQQEDVIFSLIARGEQIGYLVITPSSIMERFSFARAIIFPVGAVSFVLVVFLVVVAILLIRRFISPLADVIYAAREVANGNLQTRIPMEGPQDLRSLSESFNEMASSLERSDRERRDMLADIAHELRTPLSVIRGRLEGIVDGIYSENGSQVSMALEQTYLMQRLVDDLRLLTLAETRELPFDMRSINAADLIERVLEMFSAEAQEKNISLAFQEKDENLSIFVDPQRFEQVMSNLIGNSLRYVPEGGRVWVVARETPKGVRITINDNGPGIPDEDLPFIFDRFWRKEKSRSRTSGGTGLGLAIAKQLLEAQGGRIEARNLSEGGLQVEISIQKTLSH